MAENKKGVLDLYKAAHDAAFQNINAKTEAELQTAALAAFKAAGFANRHDFNKFYTYFGDERIKFVRLQKETLPSEALNQNVD